MTEPKHSKKPAPPRGEAFKIRSICFDDALLEAIEERRGDFRMSRSELVRAILEDYFGILNHPEIHLVGRKATRQISGGVKGTRLQ